MPPKKSHVEIIDGVKCSHNFASGNVVVGSGLVGNDERDCFKLKAGSTLESQVRARPRFAQLAEYAASQSLPAEQTPAEQQPAVQPSAEQPTARQPDHSILLGGCRRPAPLPDSAALPLRHLESNLGVAWETGRRSHAEADREEASRAAREEYQKKLDAAQATRKRNREASEAERKPCLCTPGGAAVLLRESQEQTRKALNLLSAQSKLTEWFKKGSQA